MKKSTALMLEGKRRFIREVEKLLAEDARNNQVESLVYEVAFGEDDRYEEYIHIVYEGGYKKKIVATSNSHGENLKAIVAEVYR